MSGVKWGKDNGKLDYVCCIYRVFARVSAWPLTQPMVRPIQNLQPCQRVLTDNNNDWTGGWSLLSMVVSWCRVRLVDLFILDIDCTTTGGVTRSFGECVRVGSDWSSKYEHRFFISSLERDWGCAKWKKTASHISSSRSDAILGNRTREQCGSEIETMSRGRKACAGEYSYLGRRAWDYGMGSRGGGKYGRHRLPYPYCRGGGSPSGHSERRTQSWEFIGEYFAALESGDKLIEIAFLVAFPVWNSVIFFTFCSVKISSFRGKCQNKRKLKAKK